MYTQHRDARRLLVPVVVLVAFGSCSDSSPAPTRIQPPVPTVPPIVSLQLNVPESIEPRSSAPLTVTATRSDGSSEAVTSGIQWNSSNPRVLRVDSQGVATTFDESGESVVTISVQSRRASRAILVLPNGTFRLRGQIVDEGSPVDHASVAVIAGTGEGLSVLTDSGGFYSLYGVNGSIRLHIRKSSYQNLTQDVHVNGHSTHNMAMIPERRRDSLAGQYRLNLTATGCSALPSELRQRSYDATIEQEGARLTVTVRGANLIAGDSIRFTGVYHGDGQIIFGIGTFLNYYYYWYGPFAQEIAERLSTTSTFVINGTVVTRHDGNGVIAGTLDGVFATSARTGPPFLPYSASCRSTTHAFELRRQ